MTVIDTLYVPNNAEKVGTAVDGAFEFSGGTLDRANTLLSRLAGLGIDQPEAAGFYAEAVALHDQAHAAFAADTREPAKVAHGGDDIITSGEAAYSDIRAHAAAKYVQSVKALRQAAPSIRDQLAERLNETVTAQKRSKSRYEVPDLRDDYEALYSAAEALRDLVGGDIPTASAD